MSHKSEYEGKGDRALELQESGLTHAQIAERLNVRSVRSVASMLHRARGRREKAAGKIDA